ncbi:MAG: hypothetical protein JW910_18780, partial [Anaerolineae bacterium]|nr:hypothetical protein [Anaerolineae bacterium]
LLVLDNFEHLLDGAEHLPDLLAAAPGLKLLVTSREALRLQEEWLRPLTGLRAPDDTAGNGLSVGLESYSAVQLFVERARRVRGDFSLDEDRASVARICHLVGGMPLGIELAAAWLRTLPPAEIADAIAGGIDLLHTTLRNVPERHRSIRAVCDSTWERLSDAERQVFMRLAVFRGGCTREAAGAVAGATVPVLASLVDRSLLQVDADGRYLLHELLQQYAAERLESAGLGDATRDRHAAYFTDFLQAQWPLMQELYKGATETIERDYENVLTAWLYIVYRRRLPLLERCIGPLWWVFSSHGREMVGIEVFSKTVEHLADLEHDPGAVALFGYLVTSLAELYMPVDPQQGVAWADRAVAILEPLGPSSYLGEAYEAYSFVPSWLDRDAMGLPLARAEAILRKALANAEALHDPLHLAYSLNALGGLALEQHDPVQAKVYCEQALAYAAQLPNSARLSFESRHLLGYAHFDLGEYDMALRYFEELLPLAERSGHLFTISDLRRGIANVHLARGDVTAARREQHEILRAHEQLGQDWQVLGTLYGNGARFFRRIGQPERAVELAAFVARHPATARTGRDGAQQLLDELRADLSPAAFEAAAARSAGWELDTVVADVLAELAGPPSAAPPVGPSPVRRPASPALVEPLTGRELEVLALVAAGRSNREIARELVLALGTVKKHLNNIFGKLDARNRTEAANRARALGLLPGADD